MARAFSTAASKNRSDRLSGCGPNQESLLKDPAMSTQHRAPISSASARPSVTSARFARRLSGSLSSRLTQRPTSEITTSCRANAVSMARTRAVSFTSAFGQYAARYPSCRCTRAISSGSSVLEKIGPPKRSAWDDGDSRRSTPNFQLPTSKLSAPDATAAAPSERSRNWRRVTDVSMSNAPARIRPAHSGTIPVWGRGRS